MLKAFTQISSAQNGETGYYFEFARHAKTNQILGIKYYKQYIENSRHVNKKGHRNLALVSGNRSAHSRNN